MRKKIFFNYFGAMPCRCSMPAGDYIWYQKGTSAHSSRSNIQDSTRRNAQDQFWNYKRLDGRISHEEYFRLSPIAKHMKGQLSPPRHWSCNSQFSEKEIANSSIPVGRKQFAEAFPTCAFQIKLARCLFCGKTDFMVSYASPQFSPFKPFSPI